MRRARFFVWILPCISAAGAWGAVGELKPVAVDLQTLSAAGVRPRSVYTRSVANAPAGCGTVHPQAKVATVVSGSMRIAVALDAVKADAKALDVVRFNFTGEKRFQNAATLPLKARSVSRRSATPSAIVSSPYFTFGPSTVNVPRGGSTVPVTISGQYYAGTQRSNYKYVRLNLMAAAEGSCRFGDKTFGVRVIDGTGNLEFGDAAGVTQKDGRVMLPKGSRTLAADTLLIDTGSEQFKKAGLKAQCGELVSLNGTLYHVRFSAGGTKVSAEPSDVKLGKITVPGDSWSVTLVGTKHVLQLSGGAEPVEVPVDQYVAGNYQASTKSDAPNRPSRLRSGYYVMYGRETGKVFEVKAGEVTKVPVGAPLTAAVAVTKSGKNVRLNALVRDASGARVSSIYGPKGRPKAPTVTVFNDKREEVYRTSLKYG